MAKIKIRNFGPLKENDTWINLGKVTIFIGDQGSGKSTIAKLISTFSWMEKALNRGDHDIRFFERKSKFKNTFLSYHRIQNYLKPDTDIQYVGNSHEFHYVDGAVHITQFAESAELPQIMYVPAERNFLSYIESFKELKLSSPSLREFRDEYKNAQKSIKGQFELPVNGTSLEYDRQNDILHLRGENYKLRLSEASSGFQSLVPLYLVSMNLAQSVSHGGEHFTMTEDERERFRKIISDIVNNPTFSEDQRRSAMNAVSAQFTKTAFINIVEEPEQNLFPTSQWDMLAGLLKINNLSSGNQLIMTTHSPYIINYMALFIKAYQISSGMVLAPEKKQALNEIVPTESHLSPNQLFVYELDEKAGLYSRLEDYNGMPSDENYLNNGLAESNEKFAKLLELEDACR